MTGSRIDRKDKNIMRSQLEQVLDLHRNIEKKIDCFRKESSINEYKRFWDDLKNQNVESVKTITRFMVLKCNR